jgi:hypothetical protein
MIAAQPTMSQEEGSQYLHQGNADECPQPNMMMDAALAPMRSRITNQGV